MYEQEPPFCVQVEPTEGCNLQCSFCGINGIQEKPNAKFSFMNKSTAKKIAKDIAKAGWNARIEFAVHGEPTMNPELVDILRIFRKHLPNNQLMITSNGGGIFKDSKQILKSYFEAGLNVFAFDAYERTKIKDKILEQGMPDGVDFYKYPETKDASPHKRWKKNTKAFIYIKDISVSETGNHSTLNNHCGHGAPLDYTANGKRCAKPFRELTVRWNGKIALCCNSFSGKYYCGDINKEYIEDIWRNKAFDIARKHLYHGMRIFEPCLGCNATSYRVGFLPDQKGKEEMEKPTDKEIKYAEKKGSFIPLTKEVK